MYVYPDTARFSLFGLYYRHNLISVSLWSFIALLLPSSVGPCVSLFFKTITGHGGSRIRCLKLLELLQDRLLQAISSRGGVGKGVVDEEEEKLSQTSPLIAMVSKYLFPFLAGYSMYVRYTCSWLLSVTFSLSQIFSFDYFFLFIFFLKLEICVSRTEWRDLLLN